MMQIYARQVIDRAISMDIIKLCGLRKIMNAVNQFFEWNPEIESMTPDEVVETIIEFFRIHGMDNNLKTEMAGPPPISEMEFCG